MLSGAVSTVPVSHATPGAWVAHNNSRVNTYAIADEGFFGEPNTTGSSSETKYAGGHGPTEPVADVIIGDRNSGYVNNKIRDKLTSESGSPGKHYLVERKKRVKAGSALLAAAQDPSVHKLAGLFDHFYRNADGLGGTKADRLENPVLAESARAALSLLSKDPDGFVLMVEGGAVDWAGHANNMNQMIGEMKDFDDAVQNIIDWIDDPGNGSSWDNTLMIVTGDHECGYLTKDRGILPNEPLGNVNPETIAGEQIVNGTGGRRASWDDIDADGYIDDGETVYWAWNSGGHSNSLIPLYVRGAKAELFNNVIAGYDLLYQSNYIDNSDVFTVMYDVLANCSETGVILINDGQTLSGSPVDLTAIVNADNAVNLVYTVSEAESTCNVEASGTYINAESYTGTIPTSTGTGTMSEGNSQGGYLGNGYLQSNGGGTGDCASAMNEGKEYLVNFPESGTYKVWIKGYAKNKSSDSLYIGLDGSCTGALRETAPGCSGSECNQYLNTWIWTDSIQLGTNTIEVGTAGLHTLNIWVRENDHLTDGIYITKGAERPDDGAHGVEIDPTSCDEVLFTGSEAEAGGVDTSGWTEGEKALEVTGSDAVCLTPLPTANGTFTFQ